MSATLEGESLRRNSRNSWEFEKYKKGSDFVRTFFYVASNLELSGDFAHKFATAAAEFERAGSNCVILGINAVAVRKQQEIISVAVKVKGLGHSCYLA